MTETERYRLLGAWCAAFGISDGDRDWLIARDREAHDEADR
ncbi:MAG: hypothetical protein ABIY55_22360 [Kofleriaceae bacterium]